MYNWMKNWNIISNLVTLTLNFDGFFFGIIIFLNSNIEQNVWYVMSDI